MFKQDYQQVSHKPKIFWINLPQRSNEIFCDFVFSHLYLKPKDRKCAHLLEHYLVALLKEQCSNSSVEIKGFVDAESIVIHFGFRVKTFLNDLSQCLSLFSQCNFQRHDIFSSEKRAVINEFIENQDKLSNQIGHRIINAKPFQNCPYFQSGVYSIQTIKKIGLQDIQNLYRQLYQPVCFIGAHQFHKRLVFKGRNPISRVFGRFPSIPVKGHDFQHCKINQFQFETLCTKNIPANKIYGLFIFPTFEIKKENLIQRISLNILCSLLFENSRNTLFKRLRKEGVYSIYYANQFFHHAGFTFILFLSDASKFLKTCQIFKEEIEFNKHNSSIINEKEIRRSIKEIQQSQKIIWKDNQKKFNFIKENLLTEKRVIDQRIYASISHQIDSQLLKEITKKVFDWHQFFVLLVFNNNKPKKLDIYKIFKDRLN